jgi:hypothetical protein
MRSDEIDPVEILDGVHPAGFNFDETSIARLLDNPTEGMLNAMLCDMQMLKTSTDCNIFDEANAVSLHQHVYTINGQIIFKVVTAEGSFEWQRIMAVARTATVPRFDLFCGHRREGPVFMP